jgi:hypothetical protein
MQTRSALLYAIPILGLMVSSCGPSAPQGPQPGTPAFYWAAANETYRAGDYLKTNQNLDRVSKSENEFAARAVVWECVVSSGLARGYAVLADKYEMGGRTNRDNPAPFRRQVSNLRVAASDAGVQLAESFHRLSPEAKGVPLDFPFPAGNAAEPPGLQKVSNGTLISDAELELLQKAMLQRGVLMSVCDAVGARDNTAKALEIFQKGNVEAPAEVFRMAMATMLHESALVFGPDKLDQPNRVKLLCNEATQVLKTMPASKQTKDLSTKIQKTLKRSRIS